MPRSLRLAQRTGSIIVSLLIQYALILSVTGLAGMRVSYGQASSQSPPVRTRSEELPEPKAPGPHRECELHKQQAERFQLRRGGKSDE